MDVKIDLKAEDVHAEITRAIIDSAIGKNIKENIEKVLKSGYTSGGWNSKSLVEKAVEEEMTKEISAIARNLIMEKKDILRKLVTEKMTDEALQKMVESTWDILWKKRD